MRLPRPRRSAAIACLLLVLTCAAAAHAEVQIQLTAHRVEKDAKGAEVLTPAEEIKPGQLVEYRAVYTNDGGTAVAKLFATLPIPPGTEFLSSSASPAGAQASIDGKSFAPMPLRRKVRLADGREVQRDIPLSEYRYLRWSLGTLAPDQDKTVRARVRVTPTLAAASEK
jgi:uncharacterized repeat protein (TIGR01451 family)